MAYFKQIGDELCIWDITQYTSIIKLPSSMSDRYHIISHDGCGLVCHSIDHYYYTRISYKPSDGLPAAMVLMEKSHPRTPIGLMEVTFNAENDLVFLVEYDSATDANTTPIPIRVGVWDLTSDVLVELSGTDESWELFTGSIDILNHPTQSDVFCVTGVNEWHRVPAWTKVFRYERSNRQLICVEHIPKGVVDWCPDGKRHIVANGDTIHIFQDGQSLRDIHMFDYPIYGSEMSIVWCKFMGMNKLIITAHIDKSDYGFHATVMIDLLSGELEQLCVEDEYDEYDLGYNIRRRQAPVLPPVSPRQPIAKLPELSKLPLGIIRTILSHLDPVTYRSAMSVCRTFRRLTSTPTLFKKVCLSGSFGWGPMISVLKSRKHQSWKTLYRERHGYLSRNMVCESGALQVNPWQALDNVIELF